VKDKLYLIHIIECINYIDSYIVDGLKSLDDHKTYDAVIIDELPKLKIAMQKELKNLGQ